MTGLSVEALRPKGLVLGTDFISDVLLVSISVDPPLTLAPQQPVRPMLLSAPSVKHSQRLLAQD